MTSNQNLLFMTNTYSLAKTTLLCLFLPLFFAACKKDQIDTHTHTNSDGVSIKPPMYKSAPMIYSSQTKSGNPVQTVLGNTIANPYEVSNMTAAWNALYPEHQVPKLPITDIYMRFEPQDVEQLTALQDAIDEFDPLTNHDDEADPYLSDYPYGVELSVEGDYYHDPQVPQGEITYQYAIVKPGFKVPNNIPYQVLAELVNTPYSAFVTAEAYRRVGVDYRDNYGVVVDFCDPGCPAYPACLSYTQDCEGSNGNGIQALPTPCIPPSGPNANYTIWPNCLGSNTSSPIYPVGPTPNPTAPACGCPTNGNPLHPGGCVRFEDTQLGLTGAKKVRIKVTGRYGFWAKIGETDYNGCWQITSNSNNGVKPTVIWKNKQATIKGMFGVNFIQFGIPLRKHLTTDNSPPHNNIGSIEYRPTTDDDNKRGTMYWYAYHIMNTRFDYDYYAAQEGIGLLPNNMKILLSNMRFEDGAASAPMFAQMNENALHATLSTYVVGNISIAAGAIVNGYIPGAAVGVPVLSLYVLYNLPDIAVGYGGSRHSIKSSDDIKTTYFHEFGHAAHYEGIQSGNKAPYWFGNIDRTIDNLLSNDYPPYGSENVGDYQKTAIIEAWGDHIGYYMADLHYGTQNRFADTLLGNSAQIQRLIYRYLERYKPTVRSVTRYPWIPDGLFWDAMDDTAHNGSPLNITDGYTENTSGYTNADIFSAITTGSPTTMGAVLYNLQQAKPSQSTNVYNLFGQYNY